MEPVKEYRRGEQRPQTMLSPLTGLVDAARPDSKKSRQFAKMVDAFISDAPHFQSNASDLRSTLTSWRDAEVSLNVLFERAPALREAKPLAGDLANLGEIGLEALSYISTNVAPPPEWRDAKLTILAEAAKPKAALEFPTVKSVKNLVIAAGELSQLRNMSSSEWKKHVNSLAMGSGQ